MKCDRAVRESTAERYVLRQLNAADTERFEEHFFECDCCFQEVNTFRALREGLREPSPVPVPVSKVAWWRPVHSWRWAAVVAMVLGVAGALQLWLPWRGSPLPASPDKEARATVVPAQTAATDRLKLAELAEVDRLPPFALPLLRGAERNADREFREAMELYKSSRFEAAIPGLIAVSNADRNHAGSRFFLGICFLKLNQPQRAAEILREAVTLGDSSYREEASFYLAKAYLRLNRLDSAREELGKVIGMRGDLEASAHKLLGELGKTARTGGR